MASEKSKYVLPITIVVVIAVIFIVLALMREKPVTSAQDVLADDPNKITALKPMHSEADQAAIASIKPEEAVVVPPQQVEPALSLAVQVYSFKEKARAEAALQKLQEKGYKTYIMVSDLGARGVWYRVRVGSFSKEEEAMTALASITQEFKSGIIVTE